MAKHKDPRLVFVERSKESTLNSRSVAYTLEEVVRKLKVEWKGISILSYIQAPFTSTESLEEAAYTLILNDADSAFSVEEITQDLYKRTPHGLMQISTQ